MILKTVGFQCVFMMIWSMIRMKKGISSLEAYLEKTAAALICSNRSQVPRFRFASDGIFDRVQRSALRTKKALKTRSPRQKCLFSHIIAKYHVPDPPASPVMYGTGIFQEVGNGGQVCGDVDAVGFPVKTFTK